MTISRAWLEEHCKYVRDDMNKATVKAYGNIIKKLKLKPIEEGSSLHCFSQQFEIGGTLIEFVWEIGQGDLPSGSYLKLNDWSHIPENGDDVDYVI